MHTKKNAAFIITVVLSMLILAYISFVTIYEQILSQNNGFFNVIIFGVVLILVFIFITLLARIITLKPDNNESKVVLHILIAIGIMAIFVLFVFGRLRLSSSIYPDESDVYKTAVYICDGMLEDGADIHEHIINYPSDFVYGWVLSFVFSALDYSAEMFIYVNIAMLVITALFMFLTVNLIAGKAYATLSVIIMLFMPNNSFLVYSYNSELFVAAVFMITFYLYQVLTYKRFKSSAASAFVALLCGLFGGISLSCEPVLYLTFIVLAIWAFSAHKNNAFSTLFPVIFSLISMAAISFLKAILMGASFFDVLIGQLMCFVPINQRDNGGEMVGISEAFGKISERLNNPSRFLNDNFYFLTDNDGSSLSANQAIWLKLADQLVYIFMLILCVLCIVYILRVYYDKIMPSFSALITLFIGQFLGGVNNVRYIYFIAMIIIIGTCTIYYMYLNHHPEYAVYITNKEIEKDHKILLLTQGEYYEDDEVLEDEEAEELDSEYLLRAKALVYIGENDSLYESIKEEERRNRLTNSIATTRIKTTINDEGEYDSVEESVEFFDDFDEKVEQKIVPELKPIPATRPVEVVKPVLADEYNSYSNDYTVNNYSDDDKVSSEEDYFDEPDEPLQSLDVSNQSDLVNEHSSNIELDNDNSIAEEKTNNVSDGFVFRKKDNTKANDSISTDSSLKEDKKNKKLSDKNAAKEAKQLAKLEKAAKKEEKKLEKLSKKKGINASVDDMESNSINPDDVKPGDPLPNPLPLPKQHVAKEMDFDYDDGSDDFDY